MNPRRFYDFCFLSLETGKWRDTGIEAQIWKQEESGMNGTLGGHICVFNMTMIFVLRKPAGRLGVVPACERSEIYRGFLLAFASSHL